MGVVRGSIPRESIPFCFPKLFVFFFCLQKEKDEELFRGRVGPVLFFPLRCEYGSKILIPYVAMMARRNPIVYDQLEIPPSLFQQSFKLRQFHSFEHRALIALGMVSVSRSLFSPKPYAIGSQLLTFSPNIIEANASPLIRLFAMP
jgi:hypothetical protein